MRLAHLLTHILLIMVALLTTAGCDTADPVTDWTDSPEDKPWIELEPATGPVEIEVTVNGSGLPPNSSMDLYLGDTDSGANSEILSSATTDDTGRFQADILIPVQWANGDPVIESQLVVAAVDEDNTLIALAPFTLEPGGDATSPHLSIMPESGQPGDTILLTGTDFIPGIQVAVRFGVPQLGLNDDPLAHATAGDDGTFEIEITLPTTWPGTDAPVIEETLLIAAVDEQVGQTLAAAIFVNVGAGIPVTSEPNP